MRFRPCIDLHDGKVKQIVGSTLTSASSTEATLKTNFVSEKSSDFYAELYRRHDLRGGHIIMLGGEAANEEATMLALKAFPHGMQVGGGINPTNAERFLRAGASHVIVTSYVFNSETGELDMIKLREIAKVVPKRQLVLDLSCRRKPDAAPYFVVIDKWQKYTNFELTRENLEMLSEYCDEFLIHGVEVEGKRQGILEDLVVMLGELSPIPVTYAGGVRHLADFELVRRLGRGRVDLSVGSALDIFGGDLKFDDVVKWHEEHRDECLADDDSSSAEKKNQQESDAKRLRED